MKHLLHLQVKGIKVRTQDNSCEMQLDIQDGWALNVEEMCLTIGRLTGISGKLLYNAIVIADLGSAIMYFRAALPEKEQTEDVSQHSWERISNRC